MTYLGGSKLLLQYPVGTRKLVALILSVSTTYYLIELTLSALTIFVLESTPFSYLSSRTSPFSIKALISIGIYHQLAAAWEAYLFINDVDTDPSLAARGTSSFLI